MTREALIGHLRERLEASSFPRLQVLFILSVAGAAAFVTSVLLLALGLDEMPVRYGVAGLAGYLTFLLMIAAWIAWQRGRWSGEDLLDVPDPLPLDTPWPQSGDRVGDTLFEGGRSGGGGASSSFDAPALTARAGSNANTRALPALERSSGGGGWSFDDDTFVWIVVAAAAACAGFVAVGYVIYAAPVLLAEVALDAALVSTLYRRLRRDDVGHWSGAVVRRTWMPAAVLIVSLMVGGYALQYLAPDARSIGGVVRALSADGQALR